MCFSDYLANLHQPWPLRRRKKIQSAQEKATGTQTTAWTLTSGVCLMLLFLKNGVTPGQEDNNCCGRRDKHWLSLCDMELHLVLANNWTTNALINTSTALERPLSTDGYKFHFDYTQIWICLISVLVNTTVYLLMRTVIIMIQQNMQRKLKNTRCMFPGMTRCPKWIWNKWTNGVRLMFM